MCFRICDEVSLSLTLSLCRSFLVGRHFDATTMNQLRAFIFGIRHVIAHAQTLTLTRTHLNEIEM